MAALHRWHLDRSLSLAEIAAPPSATPERLRAGSYTPDMATYPNGTLHLRSRNRPGNRDVQILRYTVVDDFGFTPNWFPLEGQVHGGIAQGVEPGADGESGL